MGPGDNRKRCSFVVFVGPSIILMYRRMHTGSSRVSHRMWAFDALPRKPHFWCTLPAAKPKQGQTECYAWVRVIIESGAHFHWI